MGRVAAWLGCVCFCLACHVLAHCLRFCLLCADLFDIGVFVCRLLLPLESIANATAVGDVLNVSFLSGKPDVLLQVRRFMGTHAG